jgi:hypothetical protein
MQLGNTHVEQVDELLRVTQDVHAALAQGNTLMQARSMPAQEGRVLAGHGAHSGLITQPAKCSSSSLLLNFRVRTNSFAYWSLVARLLQGVCAAPGACHATNRPSSPHLGLPDATALHRCALAPPLPQRYSSFESLTRSQEGRAALAQTQHLDAGIDSNLGT